MGDLIQSIPFVRRLRFRHPDARIDLLVEQTFADVARFIPDLDELVPIRLEDLLPCLDDHPRGDPAHALTTYRDLVEELRSRQYDDVWNLTHTRPAMVLSFLLAGARGKGVTLDESGLQRVNSNWLRYFFATNLARPWCQFNLVDVYANCVDLVPWDYGRSLATVRKLHCEDDVLVPWNWRRYWVALHPGASQPSKQWPIESYAELAGILSRLPDVGLLVVGTRADDALGQRIQSVSPVVNLMGKTTPLQLASVLSRCELLISNDSGPMHVAAAVGTRVLDITVGSALASETAPYGERHLVVEPDADCFPCSPHESCSSPFCGHRVRTETVARLAEWLLGFRTADPDSLEIAGARVYATSFSDQDGLWELRRQFASEEYERDVLNSVLRPAWLAALSGRADSLQVPTVDMKSWLHLQTAAQRAMLIVGQALDHLRRIERLAARFPLNMKELDEAAAALRALDRRLESVMDTHGLLRSILSYAWLGKASLSDSNLVFQAQESTDIYRQIYVLLSVITKNPVAFSNVHNEPYAFKGVTHDHCAQRLRTSATC